jgi:hypothetical protein
MSCTYGILPPNKPKTTTTSDTISHPLSHFFAYLVLTMSPGNPSQRLASGEQVDAKIIKGLRSSVSTAKDNMKVQPGLSSPFSMSPPGGTARSGGGYSVDPGETARGGGAAGSKPRSVASSSNASSTQYTRFHEVRRAMAWSLWNRRLSFSLSHLHTRELISQTLSVQFPLFSIVCPLHGVLGL